MEATILLPLIYIQKEKVIEVIGNAERTIASMYFRDPL
jgi:hypothetical protein